MKKGYFITIEGCDGCGKSSTTLKIVQSLTQLGYQVVHTREPGGIGISEQIRDVILDINNTSMDIKTEALLYAASRRQHFSFASHNINNHLPIDLGSNSILTNNDLNL